MSYQTSNLVDNVSDINIQPSIVLNRSNIESYILGQLDRINKMQSLRVRALLSLGVQRHQYKATVVVRGPGINLASRNQNSNLYKTVDGAIEKALGQLSKIKSKKVSRYRTKKAS